jgi:hypothetical protein
VSLPRLPWTLHLLLEVRVSLPRLACTLHLLLQKLCRHPSLLVLGVLVMEQ